MAKRPLSKSPRGISRRDFARTAALAAAAAAIKPGDILAQTAAVPTAQASSAESKLSPASQAEVDAKVRAILAKYGNRLSEQQKTDIRRLVTEGQKSLDKLRAFPLENADQPALVLKLVPDLGRTR
ncbi:MAG: hypothetical protein WBC04_23440 [Candidatus Acidiferrales bacterium]